MNMLVRWKLIHGYYGLAHCSDAASKSIYSTHSIFLYLTLSLSFIGTSLYYFWITFWPSGPHSLMITPLGTKKFSDAFSFNLLIGTFFHFWKCEGVFQIIHRRFVSGSFWKIHVLSHMMRFVSKTDSSMSHSMKLEQMFFLLFFRSWVRFFITTFV